MCLHKTSGTQGMILCFYDDRTCQIHEEKVKTSEELLRRRELAVKTMEDTYDQRLNNELSRFIVFSLLNTNCLIYPLWLRLHTYSLLICFVHSVRSCYLAN